MKIYSASTVKVSARCPLEAPAVHERPLCEYSMRIAGIFNSKNLTFFYDNNYLKYNLLSFSYHSSLSVQHHFTAACNDITCEDFYDNRVLGRVNSDKVVDSRKWLTACYEFSICGHFYCVSFYLIRINSVYFCNVKLWHNLSLWQYF